MAVLSSRVEIPVGAFMADFQRYATQRLEQAALRATDRMAKDVLAKKREQMRAAGLGSLGQALGAGSDLQKNGRVHRLGRSGFSASGWVFVRSGSERSRGAIDVYLGTGAKQILPVRSRYLWFPTDNIVRLVGKGSQRGRVTPALWSTSGLDKRIGPLVRITAGDGTALLIVRNVGVNAAGKPRSARSLRMNGMPRKGDVAQDFIVAFVGIPRTSRQARVDVHQIAQSVVARAADYFAEAFGRS